jgi:hypothetical protein
MDNPERIEVTEPLCSALHQVGNMDEVISARICGKWLTPVMKNSNQSTVEYSMKGIRHSKGWHNIHNPYRLTHKVGSKASISRIHVHDIPKLWRSKL